MRRISTSCFVAPCNDHARDEESNASEQRVQHGEDRASCNQRDEEQAPLCTQHGQWAVHRFEEPCFCVGCVVNRPLPCATSFLPVDRWVEPAANALLRKEPGHEVHRTDGHADAEDDASEHLLRLALAVGEHQTADDDGHKR